jgi:hypothetical protein
MGAPSDFISEQFVPSERHKAQQQAMEGTVRRATTKFLPYLMDYQGVQHCSVCKMPFPPDAPPSQDEAFAEHVRRAHRPGQTTEDANRSACADQGNSMR